MILVQFQWGHLCERLYMWLYWQNFLELVIASFTDWADKDDFDVMFITQSAKLDNFVLLQDDKVVEFKTVRDPR